MIDFNINQVVFESLLHIAYQNLIYLQNLLISSLIHLSMPIIIYYYLSLITHFLIY